MVRNHPYPRQDSYRLEAEVAEGLEEIAWSEIESCLDRDNLRQIDIGSGAIQFAYSGPVTRLMGLQTVNALYLLRHFDIPRPKALLGHENFHNLVQLIDAARELTPYSVYRSLYLSAAGSGSSVMMRLKRELSSHTGLMVDETAGDLLLRIRRAEKGWEVLVRIGVRPLATRDWRVCNMEGALNAPVASAMMLLARSEPEDVVLNLACGSGTLLIERLALGPVRRAMGCDNDFHALDCARRNIAAAGYGTDIGLLCADIRALPIAGAKADVICADLPFGQLVGSHEDNVQLYPSVLEEAARVIKPGGIFVLVTHEVRLMETLLQENQAWHVERVLMISLRGLHPRIFVLQKT